LKITQLSLHTRWNMVASPSPNNTLSMMLPLLLFMVSFMNVIPRF
jgi:hypothetical protein